MHNHLTQRAHAVARSAIAERRVAVLKLRDRITKSLLYCPDAVDAREPLWIAYFDALKDATSAGDPNPLTIA